MLYQGPHFYQQRSYQSQGPYFFSILHQVPCFYNSAGLFLAIFWLSFIFSGLICLLFNGQQCYFTTFSVSFSVSLGPQSGHRPLFYVIWSSNIGAPSDFAYLCLSFAYLLVYLSLLWSRCSCCLSLFVVDLCLLCAFLIDSCVDLCFCCRLVGVVVVICVLFLLSYLFIRRYRWSLFLFDVSFSYIYFLFIDMKLMFVHHCSCPSAYPSDPPQLLAYVS